MTKYKGGYGKSEKAIMFSDTDKRHAELLVRLRRDGLSKPQFFREIISGYISNDPDLLSFITKTKYRLSRVGKKKIKKTNEEILQGNQVLKDFGITEGDLDFIFDLIERVEDE